MLSLDKTTKQHHNKRHEMKIIQINPIFEDTDKGKTTTCAAVYESPEHAVFEMNRQYIASDVTVEEFNRDNLGKKWPLMGFYFDTVENGKYPEQFINTIPCGISPEWVAAKAGVS